MRVQATVKDVKRIIQANYPEFMIYRKARNLKTGKGYRRRTFQRKLGYSADRYLSVELIGHPKRLTSLRFMTAVVTPEVAAKGMRAITACLHEFVPAYTNEDGEWLIDMVKHRREAMERRGDIKYRFDNLAGVPVVFISV